MSDERPKKIEPGAFWLDVELWNEQDLGRFAELGVSSEVYIEFSKAMRKIVWDWQGERLESVVAKTERAERRKEKIESLNAQIVSILRDFLSQHRDFSAEALRVLLRELVGRYYLEHGTWLGATDAERRTRTDENIMVDIALQFFIEASRDIKA